MQYNLVTAPLFYNCSGRE